MVRHLKAVLIFGIFKILSIIFMVTKKHPWKGANLEKLDCVLSTVNYLIDVCSIKTTILIYNLSLTSGCWCLCKGKISKQKYDLMFIEAQVIHNWFKIGNIVKSKYWKNLALEKFSFQELVLNVPKKKPSHVLVQDFCKYCALP